ncbi:MAG: hypothetical protein JW751_05710 [Polyangiaceae bacterium]|nr:hypothetical protein [Polyangiaceae bacterium]
MRWISCVLAAAAFALASGPAKANEFKGGKVVTGSVSPRGVFSAASADGAVVELRGGTRLTLAPNTEFRQLPSTEIQLIGGKTRSAHVVILRTGALDVESGKGREPPAVLVNGPRKFGAILVQGRMTVLATGSGTTIANRGGSVLAGDGSRWDSLATGRVRAVDAGHPTGVERSLPPRPAWTPGSRLWVTAETETNVSGLAWTGSKEAGSYQITLWRDGEPAPFRTMTSAGPALSRPLSLPAGCYHATVTGEDADGLTGLPSPRLGLAVVQVTLPPGAYFENATRIRLARGQSIGLVGADGLEMSYGTVPAWVAAASRIQLSRDQVSRIRLRTKGGGATTVLELVPRRVSAAIGIGPRNATWPSVPATVDIQLVGDRGGPAPATIEARPRVLLGIQEIPVKWRHEEGRLHATIQPQDGPGPWLLRVEVTDQYEIPLGQESFEIAPDRKE